MSVQHTLHLGPCLVDRAMDHIARYVDAVVGVGLPDDIAFNVDLDQARGRNLPVKEAVEIDQQMVGRARNARGDMIVDQIGHAVAVDQAIAGGEIEPRPPFLRRDLIADRLEIGCIVHDECVDRISWTLAPWTRDGRGPSAGAQTQIKGPSMHSPDMHSPDTHSPKVTGRVYVAAEAA